MRRTVLTSITVMSLTALSVVIGACATAPVDDDLSGLVQEQKPAEPEEPASAKLPPPTQKTEAPANDASSTDAGAKDASTPPKDASTPPKDASATPPASGGDCDTSDITYYL